jgi:hypothetical protein
MAILTLCCIVAQAPVVEAGSPKSQDKRGGFDIKDLPLPVIEACQKELPNIAFVKVEKQQKTWRRGESYRIWAMDGKQRQIYMEVSATGKIIQRPKTIADENNKAKQGTVSTLNGGKTGDTASEEPYKEHTKAQGTTPPR